jgi:hypothetical protein
MYISENYTPDDFRHIADEMERQSISKISLEYNDEDTYFIEDVMESDLQAEVRYAKEMKKYQKFLLGEAKDKELRKDRLIREAKKLGLRFEDETTNKQESQQ